TPGSMPRDGAISAPSSQQPRLLLAQARRTTTAVGGRASGNRYGSPLGQQPGGMPMGTGPSPFGTTPPLASLISFLGNLAYLVFMGIGVAHIHGLSTGSTVGVALISGVATIVLFFLFLIVIGVGFAALLVGTHQLGH